MTTDANPAIGANIGRISSPGTETINPTSTNGVTTEACETNVSSQCASLRTLRVGSKGGSSVGVVGLANQPPASHEDLHDCSIEVLYAIVNPNRCYRNAKRLGGILRTAVEPIMASAAPTGSTAAPE
jgi:hypothetical protein